MAYSAQRVAYFNKYVADELYKNDGHSANNTTYTRDLAEQVIRRKAKSDETKLRERQEKGFESRKNICDECHMTRARNGTCGC